jgi:hypothetical protein
MGRSTTEPMDRAARILQSSAKQQTLSQISELDSFCRRLFHFYDIME